MHISLEHGDFTFNERWGCDNGGDLVNNLDRQEEQGMIAVGNDKEFKLGGLRGRESYIQTCRQTK